MQIVVIDGQGGGIGRLLVSAIKAVYPDHVLTAVGTNSQATAAMLKAGADKGATGENAVLVACRKADFIIGPMGIVIADSLLGEISPAMASAIGQCDAHKLLIPVNLCNNQIIGTRDMGMQDMVRETVEQLGKLI